MNNSGTWTVSQTMADELCFRYEYDKLNQLLVRKVPGAGIGIPSGSSGEEWMVYDQRNRLVMRQDGNLRTLHKWIYIQYDNLDRPVANGLLSDEGHYSDLSYHVAGASVSGNTQLGFRPILP